VLKIAAADFHKYPYGIFYDNSLAQTAWTCLQLRRFGLAAGCGDQVVT